MNFKQLAPYLMIAFTLVAAACGKDSKDSKPAPAPIPTQTPEPPKNDPKNDPKVSYTFNLVAKGSCQQTGRAMTLTYFANGQYTVSDDRNTFATDSGAYVYDPKTKTFSLKIAASAPNDPGFLEGSCFEVDSEFVCTFQSVTKSRLDCSAATFGSYAKVQTKIDTCEGH